MGAEKNEISGAEDINESTSLAHIYHRILKEEGYVPWIDDDGDVGFKFEGYQLFIGVDEADREFLRIIFPAFWPIESEEEYEMAVKAAAYATTQTKVAKVIVINEDTFATIEMFCSPPESFRAVFHRSVRALLTAIATFRNKMQE